MSVNTSSKACNALIIGEKSQGETFFKPDSFVSADVLVSRKAKIQNAVFSKRK